MIGNYTNANDISVIRLKCSNTTNYYAKIKIFKDVTRSLDNIRPDIIFLHGVQCLAAFQVINYLKKHPATLYIDNHADYSNSGKNIISKHFLHGILWRFTAKRINPYVHRFYGVLPARVDFLKERYHLPKEKISLLIMGADDDDVNRASDPQNISLVRNKLGYKPDDFLIVTGGKIDFAKKQVINNLMEAIRLIDRENVKLLIFGSVQNELKKQFDNLLTRCNRIQYVGWADNKQAYDYFSIANVVCFPGRHSVYWEQTVAIKRPMICKYWEGTTHVDIGGNVKFLLTDSVDELKDTIEDLSTRGENYVNMAKAANSEKSNDFLYSRIASNSLC